MTSHTHNEVVDVRGVDTAHGGHGDGRGDDEQGELCESERTDPEHLPGE